MGEIHWFISWYLIAALTLGAAIPQDLVSQFGEECHLTRENSIEIILNWKNCDEKYIIVISKVLADGSAGIDRRSIMVTLHERYFSNHKRLDCLFLGVRSSTYSVITRCVTYEVTPITFRYIHPPYHGNPKVTAMVINDRLTSLPSSHSWNKTISNFDLETSLTRSWVWSRARLYSRTNIYLICFLFITYQ